MVEQVSFVAGARSLNEEELKKNLEHFKVPSASVEPIRTKLAMKIFDEYANILKGMHSIRFNGRSDHGGTSVRPAIGRSDHGDTPARPALGPTPPLINGLTAWQPNKVRKHKEGEKKGIIHLCFVSKTFIGNPFKRIASIPLPLKVAYQCDTSTSSLHTLGA